MDPAETYLGEVNRALWGVDRRIRGEVLKELRAHIRDSASSRPVDVVLSEMDRPRTIGKHYREIYGFSKGFQILLTVGAFLLAIPSTPVLPLLAETISFPYLLAVFFVGFVALYLIAIGTVAGKLVGLYAGIAAVAARVVVSAVVASVGGGELIPDVGGLGVVVLISLLLVALGYMPGRAKEKWSGPRAEL